MSKIVPDTSVVIDGRVSELLSSEDTWERVVVPEVVVSELTAQANRGKETGFEGLAELQQLTEQADSSDLSVEYVGDPPSPSEIEGAAAGDLDQRVRETAEHESATLLTTDVVQANVAEAKGIDTRLLQPKTRSTDELGFETFFTDTTMSVHLKTDTIPKAKRGSLGELEYTEIASEATSETQMRDWATELKQAVASTSDAFMELSEPGMSIIQYNDYRIALAEPPFSDGIEITAVRPIAKTSLDDYTFADELRNRFNDEKRGVLIAGAPGAGKSTFAQAVGEYLNTQEVTVKTMEQPRDLQVGDEITQYTALGGEMEKTADSLLLVRPDYTIYDEVRKTNDFEVFADMRLAGVGMLGVVHATRAIDALQRLVGRVELGMIPQIVDTVAYIEEGDVHTLYDVSTTVKVPAGMSSEDLARPVIQVDNFETGTPEYEIYTFNRQVVTVPLDDVEDSDVDEEVDGIAGIAQKEIQREFRSIVQGHVDVSVTNSNTATVYVSEGDMSSVIGKGGERIDAIEDSLGINIDVRSFSERDNSSSTASAPAQNSTTKNKLSPTIENGSVVLPVSEPQGETVQVQADGNYLFTATVGRDGEIRVSRGNTIADKLEQAIDQNRTLTTTPN